MSTQTIDRDGQRERVVREAATLIVEGGLAAATMRRIATRLGCSTTVVTHYFADKRELLLETYRQVNRDAGRMRDAALGVLSASPLRAVEELLPIGEGQRRHWSLWLHFWTAALNDATLAREHGAELHAMFARMEAHLLSQGLAPARAAEGAQTICNALYGIAMQAIFDTAHWTEERQRAEFRRATAMALGAG